MRLTYVGPLVPELQAFKKDILMQDPDLVFWHFMAFYGILAFLPKG